MPDQDFTNAKTLPQYIFTQINSLKYKANSRCEDIINYISYIQSDYNLCTGTIYSNASIQYW